MYASQKEIRNRATEIYEKDPRFVFMNVTNQIVNAKIIYKLHADNSGNLKYVYFRSVVAQRMRSWINDYTGPLNSSGDVITYLNNLFVKSCYDLYEYKTNMQLGKHIDSNVYRSQLTIGICDIDDNVVTEVKKYKDLLASDYQNIDVWAPKEISVSSDNFRNKNRFPVNQKSMHVRHYDTSNEGYHAKPEHSSINNILNGYGSDMQNLIKKNEDKLARENTKYE
jgi:hypothetical protein